MTPGTIESGILSLSNRVRSDAVLLSELEETRSVFPGAAAGDPLAERRHLEWFLFDRPSPSLEGTPAAVLGDDQAGDAFSQSHCGVLEIQGIEDDAILAVDLLTGGKVEVREAVTARELCAKDLLVGRMFGAPDGTFDLSPAVGWFRDERLVQAVRSDMEAARASRRGVLRIEQCELEGMFFGGGDRPADQPGGEGGGDGDSASPEEQLLAAGLAPDEAEEVVSEVRAAYLTGATGSEGLDRIAFETSADLEKVQRSILALRGKLERGFMLPGENAAGDDPDDLLPRDFPGVLEAMVAEFAWEVAGTGGLGTDPVTEVPPALVRFARANADLGVFENLDLVLVTEFLGRRMLDEVAGERVSVGELLEVIRELGPFLGWCLEEHGLDQLQGYAERLAALSRSVPRLVRARSALGEEALAMGEPEVFVFTDTPGQVQRVGGGVEQVVLAEAVSMHLEAGDLISCCLLESGELEVVACYPGELLKGLDPDIS